MDITKKASRAKDELQDFIEHQGVGSAYLTKARRIQTNINLALLVGGVLTVAGLLAWALSGSDDD